MPWLALTTASWIVETPKETERARDRAVSQHGSYLSHRLDVGVCAVLGEALVGVPFAPRARSPGIERDTAGQSLADCEGE
jgi:hypothetical protein